MDIDAFLKGWVVQLSPNRSFCVFSSMLFFLGVRKAGKDSATGNPLFEATAGLVALSFMLHSCVRDVGLRVFLLLWRFRKI